MPQFAVLIYDKEVPFEDIPPEVMEAHEHVDSKIEGIGGKIVAGYAAQASAQARTVRGDSVAVGPFQEGTQQLTGFFVVEARDVEHAAEMAKFVPIMDGGVEVRPLHAEE